MQNNMKNRHKFLLRLPLLVAGIAFACAAQAQTTIIQLNNNPPAPLIDLSKYNMTTQQNDVKVSYLNGQPLSLSLLSNLVNDFWPNMKGYSQIFVLAPPSLSITVDTTSTKGILGLVAGNPIVELVTHPSAFASLPASQQKIIGDISQGNITLAQLTAKVYSGDPDTIAALMPLLIKMTTDAIVSGQTLTASQQALVARIADNINTQRKMLATELTKQRLAFETAKGAIGANNAYALKTMPNIAITAQKAVTEQAIAAVIGAGAGLALGGALAGVICIPSVALAIFPFSGAVAVGGEIISTTATVAGGAAVGVVGVAVGAVVIGAVSAVLIAQEMENLAAFDAAMARAKNTVNNKLSGLNLKTTFDARANIKAEDPIAVAEFFSAFTAAMFEIQRPADTTQVQSITATKPQAIASTQAQASTPASVAKSATWQQMPGAANDVGMGGGTLWVVGNNAVPGGFGIYRWDGKNWVTVPGGAVRIDVDGKGYAFIANDAGEMFRYNGTGWTKLPGLAKDVGVGDNGTLWCIGVNPVPGGFGIYRWNTAKKDWDVKPGGAVRIDVDPNGNPWAVNDAGQVYAFGGSAWVELPGVRARDIGVGVDGSVFVAAKDDGSVYKLDRSSRAWIKRDGLLDSITVDGSGVPFGTNAAKQIWMGYQ